MPKVDVDHIIQELVDMHKHLCAKDAKSSSAFVLARLMPHMDKKSWAGLCAKAPSMGWCALEIGNDIPTVHAPMLASVSANMENMLTDSLLKAAFVQHLEIEIARSMRTNAPLALVNFTFDKSLKDTTYILQKAVSKYGGACDVLAAMSKECMALILPGAKVFKAQNMVEDIIKFCMNEGLTLKAGIAGSLGKALGTVLMEQADIALQDAIKSGQDVRVFREASANIDATLVQSHEKRFLFGG